MGRDPEELFAEVTRDIGASVYEHIDPPATAEEKEVLHSLSPDDVATSMVAGDPIEEILTIAPGNAAPIGGVKVVTAHGWFAARASRTRAIYQLYAESFRGRSHLRRIQEEAQALLGRAVSGVMG